MGVEHRLCESSLNTVHGSASEIIFLMKVMVSNRFSIVVINGSNCGPDPFKVYVTRSISLTFSPMGVEHGLCESSLNIVHGSASELIFLMKVMGSDRFSITVMNGSNCGPDPFKMYVTRSISLIFSPMVVSESTQDFVCCR